jgi:hypothetical protein
VSATEPRKNLITHMCQYLALSAYSFNKAKLHVFDDITSFPLLIINSSM